nr:mitochondrial import inner membrane translocase subunit tim10 [Quercus suber]
MICHLIGWNSLACDAAGGTCFIELVYLSMDFFLVTFLQSVQTFPNDSLSNNCWDSLASIGSGHFASTLPVRLDGASFYHSKSAEPPTIFRLTNTCFNKCVEKRYKESELNMGENSCIDRCVSKYWHVTNVIGQLLGSGRPPM